MSRYTPAFGGMTFDDCIEAIVDAVELDYYPDPTTEEYFQGYKHAVHTVLGCLMQDKGQFEAILEQAFPQPLENPYPGVTIAKIRQVDTEGMWGRDKHPPVDTSPFETFGPNGVRYHKRYSPINGGEVVILRPLFVMGNYRDDGSEGADTNKQYDLRPESEFYTKPEDLPKTMTNPTWIYEVVVISGEYKGQVFELADYELD